MLRRAGDYYEHPDGAEGLSAPLEAARTYVDAGDGRGALVALEALTDEYVEGCTRLDDSYGERSVFFSLLAPVWAEALLSADLTPEERARWGKRLAAWQREIEDYGVGEVFKAAVEAARQGWDDPILARVLRGEPAEPPQNEEDDALDTDELTTARLNVLEAGHRPTTRWRRTGWSAREPCTAGPTAKPNGGPTSTR